jgi:hypothetical protein
MKRFVEGVDRGQATLFPECLEDWICEDNPVRAVDVFVEGLDLAELGFAGVDPEARRGDGGTREDGCRMNPTQEFLRHASECEQMARLTRDPESKVAWSRMAERWQRCAEKFESQSAAAHSHASAKRHRTSVPGWART